MRTLLLLICFLSPTALSAELALIIDDIGYRTTDKAILSLPQSVTFSVLPHTPLGQTLAQQGHKKGHEIMLHIPMQTLNGKELGPGGLTNEMNEQQIKDEMTSAFNQVPFAKGANNHMGSLLTQMDDPMQWVMESLKQQELFFVDSMTTRYSKASLKAKQIGVPILKRQIFLDNDLRTFALEKQFRQAIQRSKKEGSLIMIAHPYPETIRFLNKNLVRLEQQGVKIVHTSTLFNEQIIRQASSNTLATLK